mgnify:CR=1 FL=1
MPVDLVDGLPSGEATTPKTRHFAACAQCVDENGCGEVRRRRSEVSLAMTIGERSTLVYSTAIRNKVCSGSDRLGRA